MLPNSPKLKIFGWLALIATGAAAAAFFPPQLIRWGETENPSGSVPSADGRPAPARPGADPIRAEEPRGSGPFALAAPDPAPVPGLLPRFFADSSAEGGAESDRSFDCMIEPSELVEVATALTAVVATVHAERSDFVKAGQLLAELESDAERAGVAVARARAAMKADVRARSARVVLEVRRQIRASELYEGEALSAALREEVETEAELARAALEQARENQRLAKLERREAEFRLKRRSIRSPISGVVVERLKSPGEVVKEDRIFTVAKVDPLRVEVILPATMFGSVEPGMRAEVEPELHEIGVQIASVTLVDRVIDPASGTFGARLVLPNPDHSLPSGLHCRVRFLPPR